MTIGVKSAAKLLKKVYICKHFGQTNAGHGNISAAARHHKANVDLEGV